MSAYIFSVKAYTKMVLHAAKYPHLAVNGVLLTEKTLRAGAIEILDAIPFFHQCLHLSPMTEVALIQTEALAKEMDLVIGGYYVAAENLYDGILERMPGLKIADKIQDNFKNACCVIIDNKLMSLSQQKTALRVYSCNAEAGRWSKTAYTLKQQQSTLGTVSSLLQRGAMKNLVDFDNYLDNPSNDWTNKFLNKDIKHIIAMY